MKRLLAAAGVALALGACNDQYGSNRSLMPIPPQTMALMAEKGMAKSDPILVRVYKKESELEVWKRQGGGDYALLKTYPICRWSGQLGPKVREGDRQSPEGFYTITPGQMNPNSNFYLSFDTGYPNAYDRALGRSGSYLMVHGNCSSRGCYAMTDEGISEVYALAREAFTGGQKGFQFQAYPFKLTAENLARYRQDPHMPFWKNLKEGSDNFEVTRQEPRVAVCGGRYAFNTQGCAPDPRLAQMVAEKDNEDRHKVAELVAKGTPSVRLVYDDGGGHETFRTAWAGGRSVGDVSRPDALAAGPREIAMSEPAAAKAKGSTVVAALAAERAPARPSADREAEPKASFAGAPAPAAPARVPASRTVLASADPDEAATLAAPAPAEKPFYERMLGSAFGGAEKPAAVTEAAAPAVAPSAPAAAPARKVAAASGVKPVGVPQSPAAKPAPARSESAKPASPKPAAAKAGDKPQAAVDTPKRHAGMVAGGQALGPSVGAFTKN